MRIAIAAVGVSLCLLAVSSARSGDLDFDTDISARLRSSSAKLKAQAELHLRRLAGQARDRLVGPNFDPRQAASRALASTSKQVRIWRNADVRVAANGDVSLVRRDTTRAPSRRETEQDAQPNRLADALRDRNRPTSQATHFLAHRLAEIDGLRDRALVNGDVQALLRAESLERQVRAEHQSRFTARGGNEDQSVR